MPADTFRERGLRPSVDLSARWLILTLFAVTLLGAGLRWTFLDHPMRYDEAYNYLQYSSHSPGYIATHYAPNNHVLHTLMVRITSHWLGTSPAALRFPTFVGGVLLIPLTAWLAWSLFACRWVALVTALAVAGSSQLVEYSANSRGYMWLTVFATCCAICTRYAIAHPRRLWPWLAAGITAALGAYTLPLMVYPACGLLVAALAATLSAAANSHDRRYLLRGILIAVISCGTLTLLLYLPILVVQGAGPAWESRHQTYEVWGPRVGTFTNALALLVSAWTRHAGLLWMIAFPLGLAAFLLSVLRRADQRRLFPLVTIAVALAIVWIQQAPLRDRAWMPLLPLALACATEGIRTLCSRDLTPRMRRFATVAAAGTLCAAALVSLGNVHRQSYLCSEPSILVDVEQVIDEWNAMGADRCALLMRFSPAARYYRLQRHLAAPPAAGSRAAQHVLIMVDDRSPLAAQWNESVAGFRAYGPPALWKELPHCTLHVADRLTRVARAANQ